MHAETRMQIKYRPENLKSGDHVRHIRVEVDAKSILKWTFMEGGAKM
jgi:hypothetical protein